MELRTRGGGVTPHIFQSGKSSLRGSRVWNFFFCFLTKHRGRTCDMRGETTYYSRWLVGCICPILKIRKQQKEKKTLGQFPPPKNPSEGGGHVGVNLFPTRNSPDCSIGLDLSVHSWSETPAEERCGVGSRVFSSCSRLMPGETEQIWEGGGDLHCG